MSAAENGLSVQVCQHDGCFRPASAPFCTYCCDACNDADGDGLPPQHEYGCRRTTAKPGSQDGGAA